MLLALQTAKLGLEFLSASPCHASHTWPCLLARQAAELGQDLRGRRQSTVASILGRTKLTPQQADQLMAGSAAVRARVIARVCV